MKKLGLALVAFLAGQSVMLYKQDPKLQKSLQTKKTLLEKVQLFGKTLFGYNKNLYNETKKSFEDGSLFQKRNSEFQIIKTELSSKFTEIKQAIQSGEQEKIDTLITELMEYKQKAGEYLQQAKGELLKEYVNLDKTYHIQSHLDEISEYINSHLKSSSKKISSRTSSSKKEMNIVN